MLFLTCFIRLLSKSDENIFQSVVITNKATNNSTQEPSTSALSDVS